MFAVEGIAFNNEPTAATLTTSDVNQPSTKDSQAPDDDNRALGVNGIFDYPFNDVTLLTYHR
jgi:hypothetical protein